jgi:hypothetical protein
MVTRWLVFFRWWGVLLLVGCVEQALLIPAWWWIIAWWGAPSSVQQRWQWWLSVAVGLFLLFHWPIWQVVVILGVGVVAQQGLKLSGAKPALAWVAHVLIMLALSLALRQPRIDGFLLLAQLGWSLELGILGAVWYWWRSRTRER